MTGTYRKKPVEIQAWKIEINPDKSTRPDWVNEAIDLAKVVRHRDTDSISIETLEGRYYLSQNQITSGYWLIQGIAGELYPCEDSIFQATYEKV